VLLLVAQAALALLVLALCFREEPSPDTYFHLAAGRRIVAHGLLPWSWEIPRTNVYLQFCRDHPFVDHEWLFQVGAWAVYSLGGAEALGLAKSALVLAAFAVLYLALRPAGRVAALASILPAVLVAESRFLARPEVLSLLGTTLVLFLLERDRRAPRRSNLVVAGLAQVVWTNGHGFALLGPALALVYAAAQGVLRVLGPARARKLGLDAEGARPGRALVFLLVLSLASLVNPYFLEGALYPVLVLLRTGRDWRSAGLYMRIVEVQSPFTAALANVFEIKLLKAEIAAAVLALGVSLARKRARLEHAFAAALLAATAVSYLRNVPFAAVGLALPLAHGLGELARLLTEKRPALVASARVAVLAGVGGLSVLAARAALADELHENAQYDARAGLGFSDFLRYDEAVAFLDASPPRGNLFNNFGAGHFLIFARGEREPLPYICGNTDLYPADPFLVEYHDVISGRGDHEAVFEKAGITDVLLDHRVEVSRELIVALVQDPRWRLVHLDSHALLFRRIPKGPAELAKLPPPVDLAKIAKEADQVFSYRDESTEDSFLPVKLLRKGHVLPRRRPVPLERLHVASLLETLGFSDEALALARHAYDERPDFAPALFILSSLERRTDPAAGERHALELADLLPNAPYPCVSAGLAALAQDHPRDAAHDFERALERDPTDELAASNLLAAYVAEDPPDVVELKRALANPAVSAPIRAFYQGRAAELDGDAKGALSHYREALRLQPSLVKARFLLAGCLVKARAYDEALEEYEACARAQPRDGEVRHHLALARLGVGDRAGAKRDLAEASDLRPDDPEPLLDLSRLAFEDRDYDLAASSAERALRHAKGQLAIRARDLLERARRARN
jgi:tetratricopeptide (TPR) repeat protein